MLNIISIIIGIIAIPFLIIGQIPFFGWTNAIWLIIPIIGAGIGFLSSSNHGRNLNLFMIAAMVLRLVLLGGL